jgi:elongation factor 2
LVVCINDEQTGQNIIAGSGELHVEICINDLINEYAKIEIIKSNPIVSYNETVSDQGRAVHVQVSQQAQQTLHLC